MHLHLRNIFSILKRKFSNHITLCSHICVSASLSLNDYSVLIYSDVRAQDLCPGCDVGDQQLWPVGVRQFLLCTHVVSELSSTLTSSCQSSLRSLALQIFAVPHITSKVYKSRVQSGLCSGVGGHGVRHQRTSKYKYDNQIWFRTKYSSLLIQTTKRYILLAIFAYISQNG